MTPLVHWLRNLGHYLWGKRSELKEMSEADLLLAKVVLDIHRKRSSSTFSLVPLFELRQIHPLNRENSRQATARRVAVLQKHKDDLRTRRLLERDLLQQVLPSVSGIKVVRAPDQTWIAFEGNGRLAALQAVFTPGDAMEIEVEEYHFADSAKIIKRINRVRALHQLL
jgi:hypothetical protein